MSALLSVRNIETWYGPVNAIRGVSLEVEAGRIVCVLGANGAGKTTLLNTIAGVIDPAKGSIAFEGRQVFTFLSVLENLRMGAFARRRDPEVARDIERVFEWFPRLKERRAQAAGLLSGGEQQMVAIGRAFMGRPRLLLLDEPSLGLSPLFTKEIFAIVQRIRSETNTAVLVVEQNAAIALATADDGYIVELGRIVAADSCARLRERDDVRDFYLGGAAGHASAGASAAARPQRRRASWR